MKKTNKMAVVLAAFAAMLSASMFTSCSDNDDSAFQAAVVQAKSKSTETPGPNVQVTSITLKSPNSVSMGLGQRTTLIYEYEPKNALPSLSWYWYYSSGACGVNISSVSNGKITVELAPEILFADTFVLCDDKASINATPAAVVVTPPQNVTPVALTAGSAKSSVAADYKFASVDSTNAVAVYTAHLTSGNLYVFECAELGNDKGTGEAGLGDCTFALYNYSTWNYIDFVPNGNIVYKPSSTGDYYFVITRNPYSSAESAKGGVHLYVSNNFVTSFDFSETSLSLRSGESKTVTIIPTPANPDFERYAVNYYNDNNRVAIISQIDGRTITVTGRLPGSETVTIEDTYTNRTASFTVTVTGDSSTITDVLPVATGSSLNAADYTHVDLSDSVPFKIFKLEVDSANSGKGYVFRCADADNNQGTGENLGDCYFYLYDSSFNLLRKQDSGNISRTLSEGTYYFAITRYSSFGNGKGAVYVYTN